MHVSASQIVESSKISKRESTTGSRKNIAIDVAAPQRSKTIVAPDSLTTCPALLKPLVRTYDAPAVPTDGAKRFDRARIRERTGVVHIQDGDSPVAIFELDDPSIGGFPIDRKRTGFTDGVEFQNAIVIREIAVDRVGVAGGTCGMQQKIPAVVDVAAGIPN